MSKSQRPGWLRKLFSCFGSSALEPNNSSEHHLRLHKQEKETLSRRTGLSVKEVEIMHSRFLKIADEKGEMRLSEFRTTLGMLGMTEDDFLPSRLFSAFDTNNDGVLFFEEFLISMSTMLHGSEDEKLRLSFRMIDCNNNGMADLQEFGNLIRACVSLTRALVPQNLYGMDPMTASPSVNPYAMAGNTKVNSSSLILPINHTGATQPSTAAVPPRKPPPSSQNGVVFDLQPPVFQHRTESILPAGLNTVNTKKGFGGSATVAADSSNQMNPVMEKLIKDLFNSLATFVDPQTGELFLTFQDYKRGVHYNSTFNAILGLSYNHQQQQQTGGSSKNDLVGSSSSVGSRMISKGQGSLKIEGLKANQVALESKAGIHSFGSAVANESPRSQMSSHTGHASHIARGISMKGFNVHLSHLPSTLHVPSSALTPVSQIKLEATKPGSPRSFTGVDTNMEGNDKSSNKVKKSSTKAGGMPANANTSSPINNGRRMTMADRMKSVLLGPKKGLAVHFGHENWNLVLNMMAGIRLSVGRSSLEIERKLHDCDFFIKDKFSIMPHLANFLDSRASSRVRMTRFIDFAPLVFRKLRAFYGVSTESYLHSVGPEQLLGNLVLGNLSSLSEQTSEGKSGAFFYYTADGQFIIKTITEKEKNLLVDILPDYYRHLSENPNSTIVRFFGLHGLSAKRKKFGKSHLRQSKKKKLGKFFDTPCCSNGGFSSNSHGGSYSENLYFVVMGNLFNVPLQIHRRFDLKGSFVGRSTLIDKSDEAIDNLGALALKDNDLVELGEKISVGDTRANELRNVLRKDCKFFRKHQLLDYSLLVGIHEKELAFPQKLKCTTKVAVTTGGYLIELIPAADTEGAGLVTAYPRVYFLSLIDFLTEYGTFKRMEAFWKSIRYARYNGSDSVSGGPSCVNPRRYAKRFYRFMERNIE